MQDIKKIANYFEKFVIIVLVGIMAIILFFSTIELIIFIINELVKAYKNAEFLLDKKELIKIFGLIFNVLIGLELFETVKLYLSDNVFHAEIVLLVALIAVSRKLIILDYEHLTPMLVFALGFVILVLTIGYYLLKQTRNKKLNFQNKTSKN